MTKFLRPISLASALICALGLSACSSVPQNGVVATDMAGTLSQMWSSVFTGELRRAPQADYSFSGSDATLNSHLLRSHLHQQPATQPVYRPQYKAHTPQVPMHDMYKADIYKPKRRKYQPQPAQEVSLQPQVSKPLSPENPWSRRQPSSPALDGYESYRPQNTTAAQPNPLPSTASLPPRSQPIAADPSIERAAYPSENFALENETPAPARQASLDNNYAKVDLETSSSAPSAPQNWEAANEEIGDSLSYVKMGGGSQISDWQGCEAEAGNYFLTTATGFVVAPKFDSCMRAKGYKPEAEAEAELAASAG